MTSPMFNSGFSSKEPGLHNMILLSLLVHLIVITVVLVSVPTASRHLTFGPVYSVDLVSSDVVLSKNQESLLAKEIEKSGEAISSVIFKNEIKRFATTPVKKEEINRLNIEKAISALAQKTPAATEPSVKSVGRVAATAGARTTDAEFAAQRHEYIGIVWSKVQQNWTLPPSLVPKENIETIIAVRIARSGGLELVNVEKRSGNRYFDDAALKTVKKSSPFPPFPNRLGDDSIEIGIRFRASQFR